LRRPEAKVVSVRNVSAAEAADASPPVAGRRYDIVSEWTPDWSKQVNRFEMTIDAEASFLPIRVKVLRDEKLDADWTIERIGRTPSGLAYPEVIDDRRGENDSRPKHRITITRFVERSEYQDSDFEMPIEFDDDIVDHREGIAWHVDPWWDELKPWLRETLDWPRLDTAGLHELRSYSESEIAGMPAPDLKVAEWITPQMRGVDDSGWRRPGRKATVIYFFGGRAISPSPQQLSALRTFWKKYSGPVENVPVDENGDPVVRTPGLSGGRVDVIAIATANGEPELTRRFIQSMNLPFPVAIDSPVEDSEETAAKWGQTFLAFRQKAYTGTVIIDRNGKIVVIDPQRTSGDGFTPVEAAIRRELQAAEVAVDSLSARWAVARRLSQALRGTAATAEDFAVVGQDSADGWRDRIEKKWIASLSSEQLLPIQARRLTPETLASELRRDPSQLQRTELQQIENEWKRRAAALPSRSRLNGSVNSTFEKGDGKLTQNELENGIGDVTISIVPTMNVLFSNTPGGRFQFRDDARRKTIQTTDDGKFSFPKLTKGTWRLTFSSPGLVGLQKAIYIKEDGDVVELTLSMNQLDSIRGRITDSNGKPVVAAKVRARKRHLNPLNRASYTTDKLPSRPSETDQNGRFEFVGLFEGHYSFGVEADGFESANIKYVECGTQDVVFVLKRTSNP
jgi:hypothetical protein